MRKKDLKVFSDISIYILQVADAKEGIHFA